MKKNEKLLDAIGNIDDYMIDAAYNKEKNKKSLSGIFEAIGAVAAVAAIAVFAVVLSRYAQKDTNIAGSDTTVADTVEGEEKTVKETDYDKFNTSYYTYEEGDYRFDLATVTPSDEHFFFECELKVTNISDKEISLYKLGEYDSFFDFVCNFTRGEYHQILRYKGTVDESKTKITLAPGQSYSENLSLITPVSEKLTQKYIQTPHNVEVRSSVTVYPYEKISGLFLYEIMLMNGTEYFAENDYNKFICGNQKVLGLEGLICDSYDLSDGQHVEVDGYGISQELISMSDPPTLYYKKGDDIEFFAPENKTFTVFQLWDSNGYRTISTGGDLFGYLDNNPGEYYLTAELKQGGKYTSMGVKLVVTGEKTEGLIFMTPAELEGVTAVHVTSEPGSYDFSFNGKDEVKPIVDYLSSLHPLSVNNNLINDYVGMAWVIELTYGDGTTKTVYQIANMYMSKGNGVLYELDIEEASKFDRIVKGTALPDDFCFFIVWNTHGISSYDSKTGDLIKDNNASDVSKYMTTYKLTDAELERAYRALAIIDDLPDEYDPYNAPDSENKISSKPSQTIMVTVTKNGKTKTVTCENVCLSGEGYDDNAKTFLMAVDVIKNILTNTKAWQKLPDYEFYYD